MKILIIQLKRIGDLILTTPVLAALRATYPEAHVTLIADASAGGLVEAIRADEKIIFDHKRPWKTFRAARFGGDWCFDFSGTDRSLLLTAFSGCPRRVTYARFRKKFLRSCIYTDFVESAVRQRHTADHHTDLLTPMGFTKETIPLELDLPEATELVAQALLSPLAAAPFAIIHAGTARPEKYWLPERWAAVADFLAGPCGLPVVLTGSSDPAEQAHLAAIKSAASTPLLDLSGQTNLATLAAIIGRAEIFCGVDTAAMHLADALRTPCVALFGPTNPFHWRPRHTKGVAIRSRTLEPYTPDQKGGPMTEIPEESVKQAIQSLRPTAADPAN